MVEIGSIIILGILAQWIAWRLKIPAILPLIIIGLLVGPFSTFWTEDGMKWLNPTWDEAHGHGLFPGEHLIHFVEIAIGIILFEGGMTLKQEEFKGVGSSILRLISLGSAITFVAAGALTYFILDLPIELCLLFSGLIIVTGPTVIAPILRNLSLEKRVANVLKWEGILIDPIGALVAVLVYEFIVAGVSDGHGITPSAAFVHVIQIALIGTALGFLAAWLLRALLKRDWIPHYLLTIFTLAFVILVFVGSNLITKDSGLLTVVIGGMVLGNIDVPHIKDIEYFKESLSILLISVLFILLAANTSMDDLKMLLDWRPLTLLACIIFIVRPLGVFLSTFNSSLTLKEKLFISWVGPRGIVAAGIASYLGLKLVSANYEGAEWITPLVFMVVLGTVLLNATTAGMVAKFLGVLSSKSNGFLIIGANKIARTIGKYLSNNGVNVALVDTNPMNIAYAKKTGLNAITSNIYTDDLSDNVELADVGHVLAMTTNRDVNEYALNKFEKKYGENGVYRFITPAELTEGQIENNHLFGGSTDYFQMDKMVRASDLIHEIDITSNDDLKTQITRINANPESIPLFVRDDSHVVVVENINDDIVLGENAVLAYMGSQIDSKAMSTEE